MRALALVLLASALLALPVAAADAAEPGPCIGQPSTVAACGCPQGFWGVTLYVGGEPQSYVCFF
ncbi:MAG TPA: hypothetical protein VNX21_06080 [Candidatus Thermoplasmatota archaeon]|nr:hypothetical protein [Candidatus Thermoplasmatota archaeon]